MTIKSVVAMTDRPPCFGYINTSSDKFPSSGASEAVYDRWGVGSLSQSGLNEPSERRSGRKAGTGEHGGAGCS
jgi:hypothetical protein